MHSFRLNPECQKSRFRSGRKRATIGPCGLKRMRPAGQMARGVKTFRDVLVPDGAERGDIQMATETDRHRELKFSEGR